MSGGRRVAALDIGSNTVLLLVAERDGDQLIEVAELARTTRFAARTPAARERTFSAIIDLVEEARQLGAETIGAVGTAALREDEANAQAFVSAVRAAAGVDIEIIDIEREAQLSLSGALTDVGPLDGPWLLCDVGGGSTELARVQGPRVVACASLDVGAVTLSERVDRDALLARVQQALQGIGLLTPASVLAVGGSATTLAAMALELQPYDPARISRFELTREAVQGFVDQLGPLRPEARRVAGLSIDRAPIIVSGALILAAILAAAQARCALVTDRCLRWGLAQELG